MWLPIVAGSTATGKSETAIWIAQQLARRGIRAAIVNADAFQLYRGMDIGTAKVPLGERGGVPHHLLDVYDVAETATVADYRARAERLLTRLDEQEVQPIAVGGSGFYVEALMQPHGYRYPGTDPDLRRSIEASVRAHGAEPLLAELRANDPRAAAALDPRNVRRVIRAIEVIRLTGRPFSSFQPPNPTEWRQSGAGRLFVLGLEKPRLDRRIRARAAEMWQQGMIQEVRGLLERGLRDAPTASRAIGYREAIAQIDGAITEAEAIEATAEATIRLTKKQRTWFRRTGAEPLAADDPATREMILAAVLDHHRAAGSR